jgi:hypothetical protein
VVVCVEELCIQQLDCPEERIGRCLCLDWCEGNGKQRGPEKQAQSRRRNFHEVTFSPSAMMNGMA